jgi:hypothetical protein
MLENDGRFSQSESTPPMTSPLVDDFGYLGDTPVAEAVLDGTYVAPKGTDPYAVKLLAQMRWPDCIQGQPELPSCVSLQSHINGWKKQC